MNETSDDLLPESDDPRVIRTRAVAIGAARTLLIERGIGEVTHLNVAASSGLGRKTIYRHWPTKHDLLYDTFSSASFPNGVQTGDTKSDLVRHLDALRAALVHGPLKYLIHALNEKAASDPEIADLRDRLTTAGCEPIREILRQGIRSGQLPQLDVEEAASLLEGPIFYRTLVRNETVSKRTVVKLVDRFLATVS
jgi:AcrR family transcriptional regulator